MKKSVVIIALSAFFLASCMVDGPQSASCKSYKLNSAARALEENNVFPAVQAFWDMWILDSYLNPPAGGLNEIAFGSYNVEVDGLEYSVDPGSYRYGNGQFVVRTWGKWFTEDGSKVMYIPNSTSGRHLYTFTKTGENSWKVEGVGVTQAELAILASGANSLRVKMVQEGSGSGSGGLETVFHADMQYTISYSERVSDTNVSKYGVFDADFFLDGRLTDWARIKYEKDSYVHSSATSRD